MTQNNGANKIRVDTSEDRTFDKAENGRTRAKRLEDWKKEVEAETAHYLAGVQRVEDLEGWVYTEASIQQLTYLDESALAMILSGLGERFGSDFDRTKMIQLLKAARPAKQQQQESAGNISHFPTKTREGAPSDAEIEAEAGAYRTDAGKMPQ